MTKTDRLDVLFNKRTITARRFFEIRVLESVSKASFFSLLNAVLSFLSSQSTYDTQTIYHFFILDRSFSNIAVSNFLVNHLKCFRPD